MRIDGVAGFQAATGVVALLVDGENLPVRLAPNLLALAGKLGPVRVARVYGRVSGLSPWLEVPGFVPVLTDARPQSADIRLAIDAVTLALGDGIRNFVIGSCDVDFAPLALHLKEQGCSVVGAGLSLASERLRGACSSYEVLEIEAALKPLPASAKEAQTTVSVLRPNHEKTELRATGATSPKLWTLVKMCFAENASPADWLTITEFRLRMAAHGQSDSVQNWKVRLDPYRGSCEMVDDGQTFRIRPRQPAAP